MDIFFTCVVFIGFNIVPSLAQLPTTEDLKNVTECDFNSGFTISCETDTVIAIHSLHYAYNVQCESTCCTTYRTDDCIEEASNSDVKELRRACTGKNLCTLTSPQSTVSFCAHGIKQVSYLTLQYYCIPTNRIMSVCANDKTLTSDGSPLYMTNEDFPGVTIGSESCACSFEAYSCSSNTNVYTIDADLYLDSTNCKQNIQFKNGADSNLEVIDCISYYQNSIAMNTVNSHYAKIEFINNSTANQEGHFFIGLAASGTNTTFSLSCTSQPESWCVECSTLPTISFGSLVLDDPGNTGYQATATVVCSAGYETNSPTISCLANATWGSALCSPKDCGPVPDIQHGSAVTDSGLSTYGSTATVICSNGYETNKDKLECLETGLWETSTCEPKDCGNVPSIQNGEVILWDTSNTSYGAFANVSCDVGYQTSKAEIKCRSTGVWDDIKECLDTDSENDDNDGQDINERNGNAGLNDWVIGLIVAAAVAILIAIVIIIYFKLIKTKAVRPVTDEKTKLEIINPAPIVQADNTLNRMPLPKITQPHEFKHGPIYVDHGDAHIFGLTIHLPFAGKSAKQLEPIQKD